MDWLFTVSIVIILLIAGFMLFFFMPKPRVFFDPYTDTTNILTQNHEVLRREIIDNPCTDVVVPIYGFGEIRSHDYPETYKLLRCMPYVRFAGILRIKPQFYQVREYGYAGVANHTIRYFYTIKESAGHKSGVWIDGEKRFFTEKEWICGDMSREHAIFNRDKERNSVVLFIDIDRHQNIHEGRSPNQDIKKDQIIKMFEDGAYSPGHTEELPSTKEDFTDSVISEGDSNTEKIQPTPENEVQA